MSELLNRLLSKCEPDPNSGCWLWTAGLTTNGYGSTMIRVQGKQYARRAHRLSYELHCGEIPDGMFVCHKCDTPACINPDHLFLGSPKDNVVDMIQKGRRATFVLPPRGAQLSAEVRADLLKREMSSRAYAEKYSMPAATVRSVWRLDQRRSAA